MKKIILIPILFTFLGCQVMTGDYSEGIKNKSYVYVGDECVEIIEDAMNQIVLARTCAGQNFKEGLTAIGTLWLTLPSMAGKRSIRTYRTAVNEWLETNNRNCTIEDTLEIFDMVIVGAEVYLSCA